MHERERAASPSPSAVDSPEVLERIVIALRGLRFGSIEIVVQDSRVVQIERKEKFRLDKSERRL